MVTIRLSRYGRKKAAFYRIVVVDATKKIRGKVIEVVGTWNPVKKELKAENDQIKMWLKKGAQMSATLKKLLEK